MEVLPMPPPENVLFFLGAMAFDCIIRRVYSMDELKHPFQELLNIVFEVPRINDIIHKESE